MSGSRALRITGFIAVAVVGIGIGVYAVATAGLRELDEERRAELQREGVAHRFAELSEGVVHYRMEGEPEAGTVLLVHGFSTPSFVWDDHIAPLVAAGYRVICFDNYGRGFSDRPSGRYDVERTDRLIVELLERLEITEPVHIVGYSMGGAVVAVFSERRPERVASLTLLAPAGIEPLEPGPVGLLALPGLGEWVVAVFGRSLFLDAQASEAWVLDDPEAFLQRFAVQMDYEGYGRALLSTLRHFPLMDGVRESYEVVGRSGTPTLAVFAGGDGTIPPTHAESLAALVPQARIFVLPGLNHALTYSHPELLDDMMIAAWAGGTTGIPGAERATGTNPSEIQGEAE